MLRKSKPKIKHIFLISFIFLSLLNSCAKNGNQIEQKAIQPVPSEDVSTLTPEQVTILYFQAWNDKQYDVMYSLISDGFKKIEPTAKTFQNFKQYMEKFYDTALGVRVVKTKEIYSNDKEAGIEYKIEITNEDNSKKEFSSTYTLKKRASNASERSETRSQATGWKLIHPYGENIDTS